MTTSEGPSISRYAAVYVALLVIMGAQFLIGYQNISGGQLVTRFFTFAIIETILVVFFFMNLRTEKPSFIKFVIFFTIFVLACMNYPWTDSFRLLVFRLTGFGPS